MTLLITEAYRNEQAILHSKGNYGVTGQSYGPLVSQLVKSTRARSILDYGCGSYQSLRTTLVLDDEVVYEGYDPAVPQYADAPIPADLVCCIDVLEHIEPELLGNVINDLASLCEPFGFFTIHTGPARKVLSDGRNAHLIQKDSDWWLPRFEPTFHVLRVSGALNGFSVFVRAKHCLDTPAPDAQAIAPLDGLPIKARPNPKV